MKINKTAFCIAIMIVSLGIKLAFADNDPLLFGQDTAGWTLEGYRNSSLAIHDPEIIYENGLYYVYYTNYRNTYVSNDLYTWKVAGQRPMGWYADETTLTSWAPCAIRLQKPYLLNGTEYHYALLDGLSSWGSQNSRIRGFVMDEPAPQTQGETKYIGDVMSSGIYANADAISPYRSFEGIYNGKETEYFSLENYETAFSSDDDNGWNAMDQTLFYDENGKLWMVWGSYYGGIFLCEINQDTLMPVSNDAETFTRIAKYAGNGPMEGATMIYHDGYYYLCVACGDIWDTYNIRVARSETVTGPYLDYNGYDMNNGGGYIGTKLAGPYAFNGDAGWAGQGHCSFVHNTDTGEYFLVGNARPGNDTNHARLFVRSLLWLDNGWPVLSPEFATTETTKKTDTSKALVPSVQTFAETDIAGKYEVILFTRSYQETSAKAKSVLIELHPDGTVSGEYSGHWRLYNRNQLKFELNEFDIDSVCITAYDWENEIGSIITFSGITSPGIPYDGEMGSAVWGKQVVN